MSDPTPTDEERETADSLACTLEDCDGEPGAWLAILSDALARTRVKATAPLLALLREVRYTPQPRDSDLMRRIDAALKG